MQLSIDINSKDSNRSELIYTRQFEIPANSRSFLFVRGLSQESLSYVVVQLHSFYFNVTFSVDNQQQSGTNLGFVLTPELSEKTFNLWNNNNEDVRCMIAVVLYKRSAPALSGCGNEINTSQLPTIRLTETKHFIIAQTLENHCKNIVNNGYFAYLPQLNFNPMKYFEGIKGMILASDFDEAHQAKEVYSPFKRFFEKTPGTGIIINNGITADNSETAFFVPAVSYSCPANTWNNHCSDIDGLRRALSVFLVLFSVVMILNLIMPELIESILNGMLLGALIALVVTKHHHFAMSHFDIFISALFGGSLIAASFGVISLYFRLGRYLTKLTFSNLVMAIVMEIMFESYCSLYWQLGSAFVLSIALHFIKISFSVFLGEFLLVLGLSNLLKVGNIHRIFINNFHVLTTVYDAGEDSVWSLVRLNFINYKIQLDILDYSLIVLYAISSVLLTIRKELYFREHPDILDGHHLFSDYENVEEFNRNVARKRRRRCIIGIRSSINHKFKIVSRCRRHHYRSNIIHERSPLISHWFASDESEQDEVFESPNTNSRFMRTLSSESKERINKIQNFTA